MLRLALAALLAAALVLPGAAAFDSRPGGPHDDITRAAARVAGFPDGGVDALVVAVLAPDVKEGAIDPDGDLGASGDYNPAHHCDRPMGETDEAAFNATVAYALSQGAEARNASLANDPAAAIAALGRGLHALEDCFSHSNAVDLPDPNAVVHAAVGQAPPPAGLQLTGFDPDADDAARPPGDDYPHAEFAKDRADGNNESRTVMPDNRTKFEAARDLAIDAAALWLQQWLQERNSAEADALGHVEAPAGGPLPRWAPAPAVLGVTLAVGLAALVLRRR